MDGKGTICGGSGAVKYGQSDGASDSDGGGLFLSVLRGKEREGCG